MKLELSVSGDKQFSREMLRWDTRATDMRPAFEEVANDFLEIERRQFDSQGGHGSGGWKPLSPDYLRRKVAAGHDPRILHRTLRLRKSLTMSTADSVRRITSDDMFVGTKVSYAGAHQRGGAHLPQRRPVELTETDRRRWIKILQRYLAGVP